MSRRPPRLPPLAESLIHRFFTNLHTTEEISSLVDLFVSLAQGLLAKINPLFTKNTLTLEQDSQSVAIFNGDAIMGVTYITSALRVSSPSRHSYTKGIPV
ncbi:unnamed protein product [Penicillium bialowiezense]